jgi:hypothetical protein
VDAVFADFQGQASYPEEISTPTMEEWSEMWRLWMEFVGKVLPVA